MALIFSAHAIPIQVCQHWLHREPRDKDLSVVTFDQNPYHNAGLLLELFGPMKNSFKDWLRWLESDDLSAPPIAGVGLYHGSRTFMIAKVMEYPIDAGLSQFSNRDLTHKMIGNLMEFRGEDVTVMRGTSEKAVQAREKFLRKLDLQLFGIYGTRNDGQWDNLNMRAIKSDHTLEASLYPDVRYTSTHKLGVTSLNPKLTNPIDDLNAVAEIVSQGPDNVIVKIKLGHKPANRNQEILQQMFFITHWQMVQKAYRTSGLFADSLDTAIYLLDDFIRSMEDSQAQQNLYLLYDTYAWDSMMFRLNLAHRYVAIEMSGIGLQPYHYQKISDVFYPFYPTYGMIVEKHQDSEYEFKRLFHNDNPDPLNRLRLPPEAKDLNYFFYHQVGLQLPEGAKLKVVSKSEVHTRFYRRLGFQSVGTEHSAEWNSLKDTLIGDREVFLEKTSKP